MFGPFSNTILLTVIGHPPITVTPAAFEYGYPEPSGGRMNPGDQGLLNASSYVSGFQGITEGTGAGFPGVQAFFACA